MPPNEHIQGRMPLRFTDWLHRVITEQHRRSIRRFLYILCRALNTIFNAIKPLGMIMITLFVIFLYSQVQEGNALPKLSLTALLLLCSYPIGYMGATVTGMFMDVIGED